MHLRLSFLKVFAKGLIMRSFVQVNILKQLNKFICQVHLVDFHNIDKIFGLGMT